MTSFFSENLIIFFRLSVINVHVFFCVVQCITASFFFFTRIELQFMIRLILALVHFKLSLFLRINEGILGFLFIWWFCLSLESFSVAKSASFCAEYRIFWTTCLHSVLKFCFYLVNISIYSVLNRNDFSY